MFLTDVFDPKGVRVTLRVEPAGALWARRAHYWWMPPFWYVVSGLWRMLPRLLQGALGTRWAVDIEADSGQRKIVYRDDEASARETAQAWAELVRTSGAGAIDELT